MQLLHHRGGPTKYSEGGVLNVNEYGFDTDSRNMIFFIISRLNIIETLQILLWIFFNAYSSSSFSGREFLQCIVLLNLRHPVKIC